MTSHRFKVFTAPGPGELEDALNKWAGELPNGTRIRRTQLAAAVSPGYFAITALVNYEDPPDPTIGACPKCGGRWQHKGACQG